MECKNETQLLNRNRIATNQICYRTVVRESAVMDFNRISNVKKLFTSNTLVQMTKILTCKQIASRRIYKGKSYLSVGQSVDVNLSTGSEVVPRQYSLANIFKAWFSLHYDTMATRSKVRRD